MCIYYCAILQQLLQFPYFCGTRSSHDGHVCPKQNARRATSTHKSTLLSVHTYMITNIHVHTCTSKPYIYMLTHMLLHTRIFIHTCVYPHELAYHVFAHVYACAQCSLTCICVHMPSQTAQHHSHLCACVCIVKPCLRSHVCTHMLPP